MRALLLLVVLATVAGSSRRFSSNVWGVFTVLGVMFLLYRGQV
ncbi:MAG: hypothetical protein AAGE98_11335 [Actinomycetota bacterium]